MALAGRVIASHYADPAQRRLSEDSLLRASPSDDSEALVELVAGDLFAMLDDSLGWAWGYGGAQRLVGYVRPDALA